MKLSPFKSIIFFPFRPIVFIYHWLTLKYFIFKLNHKLPIEKLKRHGYLVASSWSGKSELLKLLIYREIVRRKPKQSIIVIDPHGDLVEEISQLKVFTNPKFAKRLVYIDPVLKTGYSPSINPFELDNHSDENIALMTQELKSIIKVLLQWCGTTNQMDAILSPCIATLLRKKNSSFSELQRFMDDGNNADLVELGKQSPNPQHQALFIHKFNSQLFSATKHGIYTRMQMLLNDPIFQNLISNKTSIQLKKMINGKKIILFKLSLGRSGSESIQSYWRFIVGLLRIIALQRSNIPKLFRTPTYLFIDEFQNFISDDIEKALTQLRKYGLHLILANQYVGQNISSSVQKALFASGLKIAWKNDKKSLSVIANEMDLKVDELVRLKIGEFYLQIGNSRVIKIKTPTALLGDRNTMSDEQRKKLLKEQLKLFYRELSINRDNDHIMLGSTAKSSKSEQQELDSKLQKLAPKYKH